MYVLAANAHQPRARANPRILVLNDDAVSCHLVVSLLRESGYPTDTRAAADAAFELLALGEHAVLIAHQNPGSLDGVALARQVRDAHPGVGTVLLASDRVMPAAVQALQTGVFDFMTRSFDLPTLAEHLLDAVRRTLGEPSSPPPQRASLIVARDPVEDALIGAHPTIEAARRQVRVLAGNDAPVLIVGENGTERGAVARLIHSLSRRHQEPFEVVDMTGLETDGDLLNAVHTWSDVRSGVLFFPEVSALDSVWQVELVKLLSGVGVSSTGGRPRIVASLSRRADATWEGSVLARLFERLGGGQIMLPPLRERGRDVALLAEHFAEQCRLARGDAALRVTPTALEALLRYSWPGNVDELRCAIQHAASLCVDSVIRVIDLPPSVGLSLKGAGNENGARLEVQSLENMELSYILRVLDAVGGNKASAARLLGVDRTTLYRKLQRQEHLDLLSTADVSPSTRRVRRSGGARG